MVGVKSHDITENNLDVVPAALRHGPHHAGGQGAAGGAQVPSLQEGLRGPIHAEEAPEGKAHQDGRWR